MPREPYGRLASRVASHASMIVFMSRSSSALRASRAAFSAIVPTTWSRRRSASRRKISASRSAMARVRRFSTPSSDFSAVFASGHAKRAFAYDVSAQPFPVPIQVAARLLGQGDPPVAETDNLLLHRLDAPQALEAVGHQPLLRNAAKAPVKSSSAGLMVK